MATKTPYITDEKVLATIKVATLRKYVQAKFNEEEKAKVRELAAGASQDDYRDYVVELYKKYIAEVVAEEEAAEEEAAKNGTVTETKEETSDGASTTNPDIPADKTPEALANLGKETTISEEKKDEDNISTAISFTLVIRGITNYNGTCSISCENLLKLAIRNVRAQFIFKSKARAKEFIRILESVKTIKGVAVFSEVTRAMAIKNIKDTNGIA